MQKIILDNINQFINLDEPEYRLVLEQVTDASEAEGVSLEVEILEEGLTELEVTLYPLEIARPEFFPSVKGSVVISGKGTKKIDIPFEQFDFRQMVRAFLNYLDAISFRVVSGNKLLLKSVRIGRLGDFEANVVRTSLTGSAGNWLSYSVLLRNNSSQVRVVNIRQCKYGRECLPTEYSPYLILAGGEEKECIIKVRLTEDIPAGGLERSEFIFVPDGDGTQMKKTVFFTSAVKEHPYLVLSDKEWEGRRQAIFGNEELQCAFDQEYEQSAVHWKVPEAAECGEFVYPAYSQNDLFRTAVAWKITGKEEYRQKTLRFFEGFLDTDRGYLRTSVSYFTFVESREEYARGDFKVHRAQNAGWVQEAEFFSRLAMTYDLLYDSFTEKQHRKMEECLSCYMKFAGWRLMDGDGNNFQVAECGAGVLCAMVIQDYRWINRFLYGYNAYLDLLSSVFLDDGMYFEEASGYSRLAGELFFDIVNAAEHFGISLKNVKVPASFDRNILHSPWAMRETWAEDGKPFLGMSFQRFENFTSATRCLKDFFDCLTSILTDKGIMFSVNDSNEQDFTRLYQKAYYLYSEPLYQEIADLSRVPELLFVPEPEKKVVLGKKSNLLEAAGFGILRGGESQAVLKFGGHGGYHGHYDRLSLVSFLKGGQTFHNNEYAWFGYDSFLFKMWVQTSMAHNMTVVDGRMQKPSPCKCVYYEAHKKIGEVEPSDGGIEFLEEFSAVCAQTTAEWIDPPYGGQTPYPYEFPEEKCVMEGRCILPPGQKRKQGDIGEYSEPVFQRRMLILFHGYCVVWDYLEGQEEHRYDCLYHPIGRFENEDGIDFTYTERFSADPFSAGQFVMNCFHAKVDGTLSLKFHDAQPRVNGNDSLDNMPETVIWRAYPQSGDMLIGKYPHGRDSFTEENRKSTVGHLQEHLKKTVSFTDRGKKAGFITLLEAGRETGRIKHVQCENFHSIVVEETDGKKWSISVRGMDEKDAGVCVEVR